MNKTLSHQHRPALIEQRTGERDMWDNENKKNNYNLGSLTKCQYCTKDANTQQWSAYSANGCWVTPIPESCASRSPAWRTETTFNSIQFCISEKKLCTLGYFSFSSSHQKISSIQTTQKAFFPFLDAFSLPFLTVTHPLHRTSKG